MVGCQVGLSGCLPRWYYPRAVTHLSTNLAGYRVILLINQSMDHCWALRCSPAPLPRKRLEPQIRSRPRQTWLRSMESDVIPLSVGLATAYHWAQNWQACMALVGTATSVGQTTSWWRWWWLIWSNLWRHNVIYIHVYICSCTFIWITVCLFCDRLLTLMEGFVL